MKTWDIGKINGCLFLITLDQCYMVIANMLYRGRALQDNIIAVTEFCVAITCEKVAFLKQQLLL